MTYPEGRTGMDEEEDKAWSAVPSSPAPTASSVYSDDAPMSVTTTPAPFQFPAPHHPPLPQYTIRGPPTRPSKLPVLQQARNLFQKRSMPASNSPRFEGRFDEYSGEPSSTGKPSLNVKPSTYTPPFAHRLRKRSPERHPVRQQRHMPDTPAPLRIHTDEAETRPSPLAASHVSPLAPALSHVSPLAPALSTNSHSLSKHVHTAKSVMRKPLSGSPPAAENVPPRDREHVEKEHVDRHHVDRDLMDRDSFNRNSADRDSMDSDRTAQGEDSRLNSHFSWTTYATEAPRRLSTETTATAKVDDPSSRFSWSTAATATTHGREPSLPPSPPPPIPQHFIHPAYRRGLRAPSPPPIPTPSQGSSIMSRRRPVPPSVLSETDYPPRSTSASSPATPRSYTALSAAADKKLPAAPPTLAALSHTDVLLAQLHDLARQKQNSLAAIRELLAIQRASPLDVSFADVKVARRRLAERNARLGEVEREEHEVGLALVRARRKEEKVDGFEGSGLWVRRVTG